MIRIFFFKQKTAYELRISDWSSDVCSSDLLRLGHKQTGRSVRIEVKQRNLAGELGWSAKAFQAYRKRFVDAYWIAETPDVLLRNAQLVADADAAGKSFNIATHVDPDRGATMVTVYAADHPGLF